MTRNKHTLLLVEVCIVDTTAMIVACAPVACRWVPKRRLTRLTGTNKQCQALIPVSAGAFFPRIRHLGRNVRVVTQLHVWIRSTRSSSTAVAVAAAHAFSPSIPSQPRTAAATMKFLTAITAALLPFTALAAKKPSADRFSDYRQQQLSAGSSLKLNDDLYNELTKAPRDYSVAVLLTALEARFGCNLCQEFQPEWNLLAKQWSKGDKKAESKLVFGTLDFTNGQRTFQSVRTHPLSHAGRRRDSSS